MKKILRNIALLFVPIYLYFAVFISCEPNNYFGINGIDPSGTPIGVLRQYRKNPQNNIVLGDSRLAYYNMDTAKEFTGKDYSNLAFGGASLKENLDLLDWCLENYPETEQVIFGLTFYTLNQAYTSDRMKSIQKSLDNPFVYMTNLSFNLQAVENLFHRINKNPLGGGELEQMPLSEYTYTAKETGETLPYPEFFINYAKNAIAPYADIWQLNVDLLDSLIESIEKCKKNGIDFIVLLPPVHQSIVDININPNGINTIMEEVINKLKTFTTVLDYEFTDRPDYDDTMFFDGFHLEYKRGLPVFTEKLFADIASHS